MLVSIGPGYSPNIPQTPWASYFIQVIQHVHISDFFVVVSPASAFLVFFHCTKIESHLLRVVCLQSISSHVLVSTFVLRLTSPCYLSVGIRECHVTHSRHKRFTPTVVTWSTLRPAMPPVGFELTIDQLLSALLWKVEQNDITEEIRMTKTMSGR